MEKSTACGAAAGSLSMLKAGQRDASLARLTLNHLAVDARTGDALCQRIKGNTLDLSKLPDELAAFVQALPEDGWAALHQRARALDGVGITRIQLSRKLALDDCLVKGMRQCTALRWLMLSDRAVVGFHAAAILAQLPDAVKVMHGANLIRDLQGPNTHEPPAAARVAKHQRRTAAQARTHDQRQASLAARAALEHAVTRTDLDLVGAVQAIENAVIGLLKLSRCTPRGEIDLKLCAHLNGAVENGRVHVVHGVVRGILKSPPELVDHERMLALLLARSPSNEPSGGVVQTELPDSLQSLQNRLSVMHLGVQASHYCRAVQDYAHPLAALHDEPTDDGDAGQAPPLRHANAPMLHRVCRELHLKAGEHTPPPKETYAAIKACLIDILNWHALILRQPEKIPHWHHPSTLELAEIFSSCHSSGGAELTAAQVAMKSGHPGAAGAMLMAILESQSDDALKRSLIEALGVDPRQVVEKLVSMKVQMPWVSAMADAIIAGHLAVINESLPTVVP